MQHTISKLLIMTPGYSGGGVVWGEAVASGGTPGNLRGFPIDMGACMRYLGTSPHNITPYIWWFLFLWFKSTCLAGCTAMLPPGSG